MVRHPVRSTTDELGWAIQAGANFNLADVATLTAGVGYGEGLLTNKFVFEDGFANVDAAMVIRLKQSPSPLACRSACPKPRPSTHSLVTSTLWKSRTSCASTNPMVASCNQRRL
jgi:hypothetical protein